MKNNLYLIIFLLVTQAFTASAQENSPYTRFGLGELRNTSPSELRGWGNLAAAFRGENTYSQSNPASLSALQLTVFQAGAYVKVMSVKSSTGKDNFGYSSPEYLSLSLPVIKSKWGLSFGLLPYSTVNYNLYQLNNSANGLPQSVNQFIGDGSTYEGYIATGWKIKNLSLGVSASYLFGSLSSTSKQIFSDSLNGFNTNYEVSRSMRGFKWNVGLQYEARITADHSLILGVSGHTDIKVNAKRDYLYNRFFYDPVFGIEQPWDTTLLVTGEKGKIVIPATISGGIIWKYKEKWKAGINYTYNGFKNYKSFNIADSTVNSGKISAGVEFVPNFDAEQGYLNWIKYRVGAYYENYFLSFGDDQLKSYGITIGFGLPLKKIKFTGQNKQSRNIFPNVIDFAFDFGKLGTTSNNLVEQSYLRVTLGIKFSDLWFIQRKYD